MPKNNNIHKDPIPVIEKIENQLEEILNKKKEKIEKELEERIKQEKEEAQKKIDQVEKEFEEEKEALVSYRTTLAEFENNREDIKSQIKEHLDKAIQSLTEMKALTAQTVEELKKVSELNQKFEELHQAAEEKAAILKKDFEEKFGIVAEGLETKEHEEVDLEKELAKLKKIKELLSTTMIPKPRRKKTKEKKKAEKENEEPETGEEDEIHVEIAKTSEIIESLLPEGDHKKEEEPSAEREPEESSLKGETNFQEELETLEKYRKSERAEDDGEVSYFQNKDKMILDGESLVSNLNEKLDEAKKLFIKIAQTESPKDRFYIKQEIIRLQESLRKFILGSVRLCEKKACSFPKYTLDILNMEVLRDILEKVTMENWINQDAFNSFDEYAKKIKNVCYRRITPSPAYLKSVIAELGIE